VAARCATAGDTHTASAQESVQPRLEGRVHNKVEGFSAHLALRTRWRGGGDEQRNGLEQRKQGGAVHGFHGDIIPVLQPRSSAFRRGGVEELGEDGCRRFGVVKGAVKM
jgi:hypothetical protein